MRKPSFWSYFLTNMFWFLVLIDVILIGLLYGTYLIGQTPQTIEIIAVWSAIAVVNVGVFIGSYVSWRQDKRPWKTSDDDSILF